MRRFLVSAGINLALVLAPFALLEGAFRLLPVAYLPPIQPVSAAAPVAHFEPNVEYRWSRDWNFSIVSRKRSNNYGFINAADYRPEERTPLMALIGDSLIEAQQVDAGQSVGELLDAALGGQGRVYSFGISGAALPQYLAYAQFARRTFGARAMAFVIAPNDFDESLLKYKAEPRLHQFAEDGTLKRLDYELSPVKKALRHSAVLRFAMYNLDAGLRLATLLNPPGDSSGEARERRLADSKRAVDWFLEQLPARSGLGAGSIAFVIDPLRPAIYDEGARAEYERGMYGRVARYFVEQASARGYEIIDLERAFLGRYRLDGVKFEAAPTDSHWSALGHRVVAAEIMKSATFTRLFARPGPAAALPYRSARSPE